jgi:hypothetical protein
VFVKEVWGNLPGYEGCYQISNIGRVYGLKMGRILRPDLSGKVTLSKRGIQRRVELPPLVEQAFPDTAVFVLFAPPNGDAVQ